MRGAFVPSLPLLRATRRIPRSAPRPRLYACAPPPLERTALAVHEYATTPIEGQRTGTSGLRRKTALVFDTPSFVPNYVQSLFDALGGRDALEGKTLVLGGDGRHGNLAAIQTILRLAAGNGFAKVLVGRGGLLSTPAAAQLAPRVGAHGAIVLTASHNPGGPNGDWGIKYNTATGAAAPERLTDAVYECTRRIAAYRMMDLGGDVPLDNLCTMSFGSFEVVVVDPVAEYVKVMRECFDFDAMRRLLARPDFTLCYDGMHAVTGPYARRVLVDELGADAAALLRCEPLPDFGGGHPDPNLTYAKALVDRMMGRDAPSFGAASDGDGDRNMILGAGCFVTPADSVAVIADHASLIPYFQRHGVVGVARSMPTASALDRVAAARGLTCYETPTGWKHFGTLLDAGLLSLCGEESFGTGSAHCKEKDGLWAVLAWLSILAEKNVARKEGALLGVADVLDEHWARYGRTYALRHDYEAVASEAGEAVMAHLRGMIGTGGELPAGVRSVDEFSYTDPVDGAVSSGQGVRVYTDDGERFVVRLSGTGSAGATVRVYFEGYDAPASGLGAMQPAVRLQELVALAARVTDIERLTGRAAPTVIT